MMTRHMCKKLLRRKAGFTLIEIMIVIGILGLILGIAMPTWVRQRELSQERGCQENLSKIDGAKEQYALENNIAAGTAILATDVFNNNPATDYLNKTPVCPGGGAYDYTTVGEDPVCSIGEMHSLAMINQVVAIQ